MLLYALGDAIRTGVNKAMIIEYLKRTNQLEFKVKYYGHTRSWSQIGSAISSLIGGVLVFYYQNLNIIFLFSILPYFIDFINVLSYPKYLDDVKSETKTSLENLKETVISFWNVIKRIELLRILVNISIYSGYYKSIKDFIQPFLKSLIIQLPILMFLTNDQKIGLFLGLIYFFIFLSNSLASRKSAEISTLFSSLISFQNISLVLGIFIGMVSGLLMEFFSSGYVILLFMAVLFIENTRKPAGVALITEKSVDKVNASIISVSSQMASLFSALFVIIIGFLADFIGVGFAITIMSFLILLVFPALRLKK